MPPAIAEATPYDLAGKRVLVTGASSGIGRALALAFAAAGACVVVTARREDRLSELAEEASAAGGERPVVVPADASDPGSAAIVAAGACHALGGVDVLVNNAGSAVGGTVWAVGARDEARKMFEVDFWTPAALTGLLVPEMRRRGHGAVVNVTSIRQVLSWPLFGHASAAKAGLAALTETLRLELIGSGVAVVDVIPGPVETPAQGPTHLIPGIVEAIHDRLGIATAADTADLVVDAVRHRMPRVFSPKNTVAAMFADPAGARQQALDDVTRMVAEGRSPVAPPMDELVVGADDPVILGARDEWERVHSA